MAALYGRLQGSRGEATRCGTPSSGMRTTAETWEGRIRVNLSADGSFDLSIEDKHGGNGYHLNGNVNGGQRCVIEGRFSDGPVLFDQRVEVDA